MDTNAAIAFSRFGLGRRQDEPAPDDAHAWLRAQLQGPDPAPTAGMPTVAQALVVAQQVAIAAKTRTGTGQRSEEYAPEHHAFMQHVRAEEAAFINNALVTSDGFRERLVWFWVNHFNVSAKNRIANASMGPFVREAIRPYVTGRFRDMLLAVMRHPAMLAYLDQDKSKGPDSAIGERKHKGLNENLARECLELHTVTPAAGYTQADVTNFARVLTGWTVTLSKEPRGFVFKTAAHEPGRQVVMGHTWPDGEQGGIELLEWLADHPSTHHHLAEKLVRHFVADDPPPAAVARIEAVLRDTNGNLGAASHALIDLPDAWAPLTKIRTPMDFVVASMRAVGATIQTNPEIVEDLRNLGEGLFRAPFPTGWPDRAADWAGPEAMLQRVDYAYQLSGRLTNREPVSLAEYTLGPLLEAGTLTEIRRAGTRQDGLTLLFASPEFQRR
jgi:uncharacterized protein (DUF1800 family)